MPVLSCPHAKTPWINPLKPQANQLGAERIGSRLLAAAEGCNPGYDVIGLGLSPDICMNSQPGFAFTIRELSNSSSRDVFADWLP